MSGTHGRDLVGRRRGPCRPGKRIERRIRGAGPWESLALAGARTLVDFTFVLADRHDMSAPGALFEPVVFHAHVAEFDPATGTLGSLLYTSAQIVIPLFDEFRDYTFTPGISVVSGSTYLLFLFADNYTLEPPYDSRLRLATPSGAAWPSISSERLLCPMRWQPPGAAASAPIPISRSPRPSRPKLSRPRCRSRLRSRSSVSASHCLHSGEDP
jgi:hypothetical protein